MAILEYLTVDYDAGKPAQQVTDDLNTYGLNGWQFQATELTKSNLRRVIFMRDAAGSQGITDDAPSDGVTYGRLNATWSPVLSLAGGIMNGAIVLPGDPANALEAAPRQYVDAQIADLNDVYMRWVPYTGPPQSFLNQDVTRDGDWTMVANKNTSDRPAPQPSGPEDDLLGAWTPTQQNIRATFIVANEFTVNTGGWIDQYGVDVNPQNIGAAHAIMLQINGVTRDSLTAKPDVAGMNWQNITPILIPSGSVIRVSVQVSQIANNQMYYDQQTGWFATPPNYCSLAQGSFNNGPKSSDAYDCHVLFIPGTFSLDWDVLAFGGTGAAGGDWLQEAPIDGFAYGRLSTAWARVLPLAGGILTGGLILNADPAQPLGAATKGYADTQDALRVAKAGDTMTGPLILNADPAQPLGASTKGYADAQVATKVAKAGDTMTGLLTLSGPPTANLHAASKQYVDTFSPPPYAQGANYAVNQLLTYKGIAFRVTAPITNAPATPDFTTLTPHNQGMADYNSGLIGALVANYYVNIATLPGFGVYHVAVCVVAQTLDITIFFDVVASYGSAKIVNLATAKNNNIPNAFFTSVRLMMAASNTSFSVDLLIGASLGSNQSMTVFVHGSNNPAQAGNVVVAKPFTATPTGSAGTQVDSKPL
jgi:hypothetical protein